MKNIKWTGALIHNLLRLTKNRSNQRDKKNYFEWINVCLYFSNRYDIIEYLVFVISFSELDIYNIKSSESWDNIGVFCKLNYRKKNSFIYEKN